MSYTTLSASPKGFDVPLRVFVDAMGVTWRAWDVQAAVARRQIHRRKRQVMEYDGTERRRRRDRRFRRARTPVAWLAFASETEKRRIYPIPAGWESAPVDDLRRWCSEAVPPPVFVDWVDPPQGAEQAADNPPPADPIQPDM
jgi:hypothetical protein